MAFPLFVFAFPLLGRFPFLFCVSSIRESTNVYRSMPMFSFVSVPPFAISSIFSSTFRSLLTRDDWIIYIGETVPSSCCLESFAEYLLLFRSPWPICRCSLPMSRKMEVLFRFRHLFRHVFRLLNE